ncbi:MAG: T9SS type A sorting domain-containing protein [Ignavibacteriaceae bacterium]
MVNFQEDRDESTFGNGKFGSIYSKDYGNTILDPLPHNKQYFEAHLEFVKNYYQKVSGKNLTIIYQILPDTFSVSQTMRNFTPANNSNDFTPIGDFSKEVWALADNKYPGFNFSDFNVFLIFHAGVGRDISLPGSLGTEKDIPSIYLGLNGFKKIYGEEFNGIPVSNNSFNITNSIIIPETESRELSSIGGQILFEISINGLLVSSVASHLGLPDLFDTETGLSAIGRFGLMDGQAIFAYGGTFPPEPSPWEKIYLGWASPVTISPRNYNIDLITREAASLSDTVILKIPINSSEYFLVENRNRDANSNGSIVKLVVNGDTLIQTFDKDTTGYYSFDVDSLKGVVVDVDEFDWAVPGNGIVIWHIDENIISQKIAENKINVDKNNRGVDVEEADGIQDIGEQFQTIFGDIVIGEGEQNDLWFSGNNSQLYKNKFSKDTRPNSNTNSGANSLITISDFSSISNKMSFKVIYGDSIVKPIFSKQINLNSINNKLTSLTNGFALLNDSNLVVLDTNGNQINFQPNFSSVKPASTFINSIDYIIGASGSNLHVFINDSNNPTLKTVDIGEKITAPPVIIKNSLDEYQILIGTLRGKLFSYSFGDSNQDPTKVNTFNIDSSYLIKKIAINGDEVYSIGLCACVVVNGSAYSPNAIFSNNGFRLDFSDETAIDLAETQNSIGEKVSIVLTNRNNFTIIKNSQIQKKFNINAPSLINSFALADLKNDGENYIVFTNGNKIEARNLNGSSADNFPFEDPLNIGFAGTPLTADFEGDSKSEIIASTTDGRIFAIDGGTGKVVPGFPISIGASISSTPIIFSNNGKTSFAAINNQNYFSAWNIGSAEGKNFWSEENGNNFNSAFVPSAKSNNFSTDFFPSEKAYNYPNPVYGGETQIRYYVAENSKINIKIFDLAGDFVAELNDNASGGLDNETTWNVNDIQSGVYLARIEAVGESGKSEQNIIKIAIIK